MFSYFINFETIQEKDILTAILVEKKGQIIKLSLKNELIVDCDFFKIHEIFDKHAHSNKREKSFYSRLGFITIFDIINLKFKGSRI